jgi:hypothetical protein
LPDVEQRRPSGGSSSGDSSHKSVP